MTLLSHYFQPDTDPAIVRMAAADWWDVLSDLPEAAIAEACRAYLRDEPSKRPTPGAIRALAIRADEVARWGGLTALPPPEPKPEPPRVVASMEARARILAEAGMTEDRLTRAAPKRMDTSPAEETRP